LKLYTVNSLVSQQLDPIVGFSQLDLQTNPNPGFHSFARTP